MRRLFDRTARHYDRLDALLSLGTGARHRRAMLLEAGLEPPAQVLDVATGTGLVAREARRLLDGRGRVIGLDPSAGMLAQARRQKAADALVQGRAEALPFPDQSFDFLSMGYALRHLADLTAVFAEFHRVLRPGGRLLILELGHPRGRLRRLPLRLYLGRVAPVLSLLATGNRETHTLLRYYWDTIESCAPPETILCALHDAGLAEARCASQLDIVHAYTARREGMTKPRVPRSPAISSRVSA